MRTPTMALWALLPLLPYIAAIEQPQTWMAKKRDSTSAAVPLSFESVGDAGISAQMMFLGTKNKVYILDKTENNPTSITGVYGTHPAWAVEYDIQNNTVRTMDVYSNTFCAGGSVMGNGTWAVFGGNQPVTTGGVATASAGAYDDNTGGTAIRMLTPCDDETCEYVQGVQTYDINADTGGYLQMTGKRWYPTVETLPNGTLIIIGGDQNGGYVNTAAQDNPTYEYFPPLGGAVTLQFLTDCLPVNLYPLTWLMPSGKLFMQAASLSILYDYETLTTTNLPNMPYATRVYPASAATAMLPLLPSNNYTPTILFCGGSNTTTWGNDGGPGYNVTAVPADKTCVRITPEASNPEYTDDDDFPEGRSMGQFVMLPDGTMWMGNGVAMGTAGYGYDGYSVGQSYGQAPLYGPAIYNASAPAGQRWNQTGLQWSTNERMYHSTAILLPDSSILISGSNPNADFTSTQWRSRTDVERWYPWYYNEPRPTYSGCPESIGYGGAAFNITLDNTDPDAVASTKVVLIRGGFNTHAMGFGQRFLELETSYYMDLNTNQTTIYVSQLPGSPGPTLFQPGPALLFVVTNGVPSEGEFVMIGTGQLETQPTKSNPSLPSSTVIAIVTPTSSSSSAESSATASVSTSNHVSSSSANPLVAALSLPLGLCTLALALSPMLL